MPSCLQEVIKNRAVTQNLELVGACDFFVSDIISGGLLGHLHQALGANC